MICPHCSRTIAEQQRYMMSREQHAEIPGWLLTAALVGACFVAIVGILTLQAA